MPDPLAASWRSACSNEAHCVQVGRAGEVLLVRDSVDPDGPRLAMTREAFAGLLAALGGPSGA